MLHPNRRTVSVIMERLKPAKVESKDGGMSPNDATKELASDMGVKLDEPKEKGPSEDCCVAAEAILEAIQKNDPKALAQALLDFSDIAEGGDEEEDTSKESDQESY